MGKYLAAIRHVKNCDLEHQDTNVLEIFKDLEFKRSEPSLCKAI